MKLIYALSAAALLTTMAIADQIVTSDGSTVNGDIVGIDAGVIKIDTKFAGTLSIKQENVVSLSTENPVYLKLENGSTYLGTVDSSDEGVFIATEHGRFPAQLEVIDESWWPGEISPSEKELSRDWIYEAAFDLTGKTGNSESTGLGASFRATLEGPQDTLEFFAGANFEDVDGVKSADDARGTVDYTNKISPHYNWYVRTAFGYDAIKDIEQYFTVAAGFGRVFYDNENRFLNVRGGIGYLYESYDDVPVIVNGMVVDYEPRDPTSAASIDLGLTHKEHFDWALWVNRITYLPTIDDFGNFRAIYDSSLEMPLTKEGWSIRSGINFNYDSEADLSDKEELDITYYIRMVLRWP